VLGLLHGLSYVQGLTTGVGVGLLAFMLASRVVPQFMTDGTLWWGVGLAAVLRGTDCYRQRFFLGGRTEWGLHWRAGLLQLAKWPYLGLALLEVLFDRHYPCWVTPKVRAPAPPRMVVRAHLPIVALLVLAWTVGAVVGHSRPLLLYLGAAELVLASLTLIWTEWWTFPAPYDKRLWERQPHGG